ncbi:hypothetical protein [Paragemmobacter ruber]|uniref:Uncharacterized protein n=1 Tax=Paragemmobacter ruber TaxID=1985673 RepID=A0ABW9Y0M9_9RHOB|nr:hypothetical protein [Rhodobacter ruber]NBE05952.1 hypothetical protein [Rhodobacter ruber]
MGAVGRLTRAQDEVMLEVLARLRRAAVADVARAMGITPSRVYQIQSDVLTHDLGFSGEAAAVVAAHYPQARGRW